MPDAEVCVSKSKEMDTNTYNEEQGMKSVHKTASHIGIVCGASPVTTTVWIRI